MTAKQYLSQLSKIEYNIRILSDELEERRTRLMSTAAPSLGEKVQSSPKADAFASAIAALADKDLQRQDLILEYEIMRDQIVDQIRGLEDPVQAQVLFERYVHRKRWEVIASEMNYSIQRIFQIHGNALVAFYVKYLSK